MTGRLHAWLRQAHSDLALAVARAVVVFADQQLGGLDGPDALDP
jgi:hypothetical protein